MNKRTLEFFIGCAYYYFVRKNNFFRVIYYFNVIEAKRTRDNVL